MEARRRFWCKYKKTHIHSVPNSFIIAALYSRVLPTLIVFFLKTHCSCWEFWCSTLLVEDQHALWWSWHGCKCFLTRYDVFSRNWHMMLSYFLASLLLQWSWHSQKLDMVIALFDSYIVLLSLVSLLPLVPYLSNKDGDFAIRHISRFQSLFPLFVFST